MIRTLVASALFGAAFLSLPLHAQFDGLVTTDDGSTLLFASPWRLTGSGDSNLGKIYRWDSHGFATVFSPAASSTISQPYAVNPLISGDGTITAYLKYPGCSGSACSNATYTPVLTGATLPASLATGFRLQLSRNGRYLAVDNSVLDRNTGTIQVVTTGSGSGLPEPIGGRFGIGNSGGMLYLVLHKTFIISTVDLVLSDRPSTVIVNSSVVFDAAVSPAENRVVYEISGNTSLIGRQLWSYDVNSGQATKLEDFDFGTFLGVGQYQPTFSNDGMRLVYRRKNATTHAWEAVVHDYATGATTVLAPILPSSGNFTITGDGKSAWIHGADGHLVRIAIDTLAVATDAGGRHAWVSQREGAAVFGSYNRLFGGFPTGSANGAATDLTVDISGLSCPLLNETVQELDTEIPWDISPGNFTLTLHSPSSPFESLLPIDVVDLAPAFERSGMPYDADRPVIVIHEDFLSLATVANPVLAGETIHLYMSGLGSVQPQPLTGRPSVPLATATQKPMCSLVSVFPQAEVIAPVLFAGIAPGMIGIYQVDVTIPSGYPPSIATLQCVDQSNAGLVGDYTTFSIASGR